MAADPDPSETGPVDWLGYRQYARALWGRIAQGFAQESARARSAPGAEEPAADPLVVGIYGEWGVGKSRLLELVYQLAAAQTAQDCAQRVLDPAAWTNSPALRLTIPVWFHPWKYEHEQHLAVPMLMHIADALRSRLKEGTTLGEQTAAEIKKQAEALNQTAKQVGSATKRGVAWIKQVASVTHVIAGNELVKTVTGVAAGFVGMTGVTDKGLDWIARTSGTLAGKKDDDADDDDDDSEDDADAAADENNLGAKRGKDKPAKRPERIDARPTHSADGRYYYNVQKYLRELTCITPKSAREHGLTLKHEVHLNIVVFVDDLDRCLPEKAVEVLEVIKTLLNIENFAFVVALDDEVIERGISHRYRDYRFEGAKPEMPITGFEYLEKIVHLPFRLPQLTRMQAASFILKHENRMVDAVAVAGASATPAPRLWYVPAAVAAGATAELQASPLVSLLLDSFEAFVPRKLARTLELMNQFQQVLADRGTPMQIGTGASSATLIDARMVLFTALMQLFAPEVFRLIRRRPGMFGQWLRAHLSENITKSAVLGWRKATPDDPLVLEVSDADLYRWAALGSEANVALPPDVRPDSPADGTRSEWSAYLRTKPHSQSDRHSIEQLRLPFAVAISDFRDTQRHAFSPLRLGAGLAFAMAWPYDQVPSLQGYLQLFGDTLTAPVAGVALSGSGVTVASGQGTLAVPPPAPSVFGRAVNVREMLELITSPDAATRASLVERLGLLDGETLDAEAVGALAATFGMNGTGSAERLQQALGQLGPHLDAALVAQYTWPGLALWPFVGVSEMEIVSKPDDIMDAAAPYARLHALGLSRALGMETTAESARRALLAIVEVGDAIDVQRRTRAGDLLGQLGDPRFDSENFGLPKDRAYVRDDMNGKWRDSRLEEERILGFVRVPKGAFTMGKAGSSEYEPRRQETIEADFFIGRTLVTVDQYARFIQDGGYRNDTWWDATGVAWKQGRFNSEFADDWVQSNVHQRPTEKRSAPHDWESQRPFGNRPVSQVNWFEARAYARWLNDNLRSQISTHLPAQYHVMLPTEKQWERAARASGLRTADARQYPWGDGASNIGSRANVTSTSLGRTSPVYSFEATLLGLDDMVGNLCVWTDNLFLPLNGPTVRLRKDATFRQTTNRAELDKDDLNVARGAGWSSPDENATCTNRQGVTPDTFSNILGIRLVLSSV